MKKLLLFLSFTFYFLLITRAQDSCKLQISLLTCAPGQELYSTFGHTAVRVKDLSTGTDDIYNYGTFDFGPDFYSKFIRGKLLYYLSVEDFNDFFHAYQMQSRSIQEQVLHLDCGEKQKLFEALNTNAQPQNRYYRYDFLFDNCTTRAGAMVEKNSSQVVYKNILPAHKLSFRHLIHSYLDAGNQYWSKLGIDILLGVKLDRQVSNKEAMFLPDYLLKGFDSTSVNGHPLVREKQTILAMPSAVEDRGFFSPFLVFALILSGIASLIFVKTKWAGMTISIFDFLLFFLSGLAGILLLFMWFGTDHVVCRNNYNLLWALPVNVIAAFSTGSKKSWSRYYFRFVFFLTTALLISWWFLPQQMNNALIPLLILIILRSWNLSKKSDYAGKTVNHQR